MSTFQTLCLVFEEDEADFFCGAAGLKAAIHNLNVSEEAKEAAKERLDAM